MSKQGAVSSNRPEHNTNWKQADGPLSIVLPALSELHEEIRLQKAKDALFAHDRGDLAARLTIDNLRAAFDACSESTQALIKKSRANQRKAEAQHKKRQTQQGLRRGGERAGLL